MGMCMCVYIYTLCVSVLGCDAAARRHALFDDMYAPSTLASFDELLARPFLSPFSQKVQRQPHAPVVAAPAQARQREAERGGGLTAGEGPSGRGGSLSSSESEDEAPRILNDLDEMSGLSTPKGIARAMSAAHGFGAANSGEGGDATAYGDVGYGAADSLASLAVLERALGADPSRWGPAGYSALAGQHGTVGRDAQVFIYIYILHIYTFIYIYMYMNVNLSRVNPQDTRRSPGSTGP